MEMDRTKFCTFSLISAWWMLLSFWVYPLEGTQVQCFADCASGSNRPVGPTRPETRDYPYFKAPDPNPHMEFCEAGCTYFFQTSPTNETCKARCDYMYRYNGSVGYSDLAEVARLECHDGCDIALYRCQPGYYCAEGAMVECPVGTYRDVEYNNTQACNPCPEGRYREIPRGRYLDSCTKCRINTYLNFTGSFDQRDCLRCPDGTYTLEEGQGTCKCITQYSCKDKYRDFQRGSMPFIGRW
mmetsp:Transcript_42331/g.73593  ORF Transcript_42331/g.73593 Transcript_42331/m.73593 type:complete len:241 (-) Transcript_42331:247-969(-)